MADGFIHTVWKDDEWQNEVEGSGDRVPGTYSTKEEAVDSTEHVVHNQDGTFAERHSYAK